MFTETTLTAVIPALTRRNPHTTLLMLRVWTIVLLANLAATWVFAAIAAYPGVFLPPTVQAMVDLSARTMDGTFWHTALTGGSAGWPIGLMVWLLPDAGPSRPLIIVLLTYVIAICECDRDLRVSAYRRRIGGSGLWRVHRGGDAGRLRDAFPVVDIAWQRSWRHDPRGPAEPRATDRRTDRGGLKRRSYCPDETVMRTLVLTPAGFWSG
jgi:hypothetical protein